MFLFNYCLIQLRVPLINLHFNCFYIYLSNSFYFSRFFGTRKLQLNFHLILRTLLHGAHFHFALNYFTLHLALCPAESPQIRTRIRIFRLELYWARARALLLYVMVGGFSLGAEPTTTTKTDFPRWAFAFIFFLCFGFVNFPQRIFVDARTVTIFHKLSTG